MNADLPAPETYGYYLVSRATVLGAMAAILLLTGLMMGLFLKIDLETLFAREAIALKIGQTRVSLPEFRQLKALSGKGKELSDAAFAAELTEVFLLAEEARRFGLDRHPAFEEQVARFDRAVATAGEGLMRGLYLAEELARLTREHLAAAPEEGDSPVATVTPAVTPAGPTADRLQVRTLLVPDEEIALRVLREAASGSDFGRLNAAWSRSPYAPVGGDLGQVGEDDLPPGVFRALSQTPIGSLSRQFADEQGVHLFVVLDRPRISSAASDEIAGRRMREGLRRRALDHGLARLRATIPVYVHPSLR